MQLTAYLTAVVLALASVGQAHHEMHYKATFRRYKDPNCHHILEHKHHPVHGPGVEVKEGKCHNWKNPDHGFQSYNFNWRPHAGEDEITDKTCQFEFYDEHNCKGQVISVLEEVEDLSSDNKCQNLGRDHGGYELHAHSVRVRCTKVN